MSAGPADSATSPRSTTNGFAAGIGRLGSPRTGAAAAPVREVGRFTSSPRQPAGRHSFDHQLFSSPSSLQHQTRPMQFGQFSPQSLALNSTSTAALVIPYPPLSFATAGGSGSNSARNVARGTSSSATAASRGGNGGGNGSTGLVLPRRRRHSSGVPMRLDMRSLVAQSKKSFLNGSKAAAMAVAGLAAETSSPSSSSALKSLSDSSTALAKARSKSAQKVNDSMVYLDGPQVYTCAQCRTHLTSHDDIISKSFHGRHGRAYLFDQCVNVTVGPAEDRLLITGLHSVSDIFCKRCKNMVGWTYAKAYEASQKYKEGKFIIEKINLHLEEQSYYDVEPPAGERCDKWRRRSMSWGTERDHRHYNFHQSCPSIGAGSPAYYDPPMSPMSPRSSINEIIYEYRPSTPGSTAVMSPRQRASFQNQRMQSP